MSRIGIYGGTFNPPHRGHMQAARQAVELLNLDKLLLIPDRCPPHKTMPVGTPSAWERLELVRLAAQAIGKAEASDLELLREGRSYTADTMTLLRQAYPEDELFFLMGTDMLLAFPRWREPEKICRQATLVVMLRECEEPKLQQELQAQARYIQENLGGQVRFLENRALPMASTDVRRMLTFQAVGEMLEPAVLERIQAQGLYGVNRDLRGLSMEGLEAEVVRLLDPKRVPHVLGCRDTAAKLAEQYGANPRDAARAGLLHDVTKALPPELQLQLCQEYGIALAPFSRDNPKTLHATTGAWVARKIFGENDGVFEAIASHTTGCGHMNSLQKILYIADYMEPNRDFPGVERLRAAVAEDLDRAVLMGLEMTVDMLRSQGRRVAQDSLEAIASLQAECMQRTGM